MFTQYFPGMSSAYVAHVTLSFCFETLLSFGNEHKNFIFCELDTAWKLSKYEVISGPYFPLFGQEITSYLDTFHAVR